MVATTGAHISFSNWAVGPKRGWSAPLEVRRLCSSLGCQRLRPQAWGPVLKFTVWCSSPSCLPISAGVPLVTACGLDRNNQLWGKPRLPGRAQPLGTEFPESDPSKVHVQQTQDRVWKKGTLLPVGGNAKWCGHCGQQSEASLKTGVTV